MRDAADGRERCCEAAPATEDSPSTSRPSRCLRRLGWETVSLERQDGARDLAGLHRAEGLVDVLQLSAPRHHLVEQQTALAVEVEVARDVDAEAVGAHARG